MLTVVHNIYVMKKGKSIENDTKYLKDAVLPELVVAVVTVPSFVSAVSLRVGLSVSLSLVANLQSHSKTVILSGLACHVHNIEPLQCQGVHDISGIILYRMCSACMLIAVFGCKLAYNFARLHYACTIP